MAAHCALHELRTLGYELSIDDKDPTKIFICERCPCDALLSHHSGFKWISASVSGVAPNPAYVLRLDHAPWIEIWLNAN